MEGLERRSSIALTDDGWYRFAYIKLISYAYSTIEIKSHHPTYGCTDHKYIWADLSKY